MTQDKTTATTIVDLFQSMPSPNPDQFLKKCSPQCAQTIKECLEIGQSMLKTELYTYQKNAVSKMIQQELEPCLLVDLKQINKRKNDPTNSSIDSNSKEEDVDQRFEYFKSPYQISSTSVGDDSVEKKRLYINSIRGGIISEDMGTGKTCECIALITSTRHQMALPNNLEYRGVYLGDYIISDSKAGINGRGWGEEMMISCPLGIISTKLYSDIITDFKETQLATARMEDNDENPDLIVAAQQQKTSLDKSKVKSLLSLAAYKAITLGMNLRVATQNGQIPKEIWKDRLENYPAYYKIYPSDMFRATRLKSTSSSSTPYERNAEDQYRKIFISSATLVVVPDNLIDQWQNEINKHIKEDTGTLDVLVLGREGGGYEIPSSEKLVHYDMVLITDTRFAYEEKKSTSAFKGVPRKCVCPYVGNTRTVVCRCKAGNPQKVYFSPLLGIHWKRLIVDEGHVMSRDKSNRMLLADKLIVERRWICTGTPTRNLAHALQSESLATASTSSSHSRSESGGDKNSSRANLSTRSNSSPSINRKEITRAQDLNADDFYRLGKIIGSFLKLPPFGNPISSTNTTSSPSSSAATTTAWSRYVTRPFKKPHDNPHQYSQAKQLLTEILHNLIIRNQKSEIEKYVILPPLHESTVILEPTYYQAMTYNIYVALFHLNAITSEREHQDYLFHESNRASLILLLTNLRMSCSWLPSYSRELEASLKRAKDALQDYEDGKRRFPNRDVRLLKSCIRVLEQAVNDSDWRYLMLSEDMGYFVDELTEDAIATRVYQSSLVDKNVADGDGGGTLPFKYIMRPKAIEAFQKDIRKMHEQAHQTIHENNLKKEEPNIQDNNDNYRNNQNFSTPAASKDIPVDNAKRHSSRLTSTTTTTTSSSSSSCNQLAELTQKSIQINQSIKSQIIGTTCTKLSYLLTQILKYHNPHQPSAFPEKCLIFTQNQNDMYFIYNALELLRIPALYYCTYKGTKPTTRSQAITTFNTSSKYSVIIMDIKLAAFGIDLSTASRIWFFNPISQYDVERQAIKRAHRIGQVREVVVETLVTKGTVEEELIRKKFESDGDGGNKKGSSSGGGGWLMEDDRKMRNILKNAKFIPLKKYHQTTTTTNHNFSGHDNDGLKPKESNNSNYDNSKTNTDNPKNVVQTKFQPLWEFVSTKSRQLLANSKPKEKDIIADGYYYGYNSNFYQNDGDNDLLKKGSLIDPYVPLIDPKLKINPGDLDYHDQKATTSGVDETTIVGQENDIEITLPPSSKITNNHVNGHTVSTAYHHKHDDQQLSSIETMMGDLGFGANINQLTSTGEIKKVNNHNISTHNNNNNSNGGGSGGGYEDSVSDGTKRFSALPKPKTNTTISTSNIIHSLESSHLPMEVSNRSRGGGSHNVIGNKRKATRFDDTQNENNSLNPNSSINNYKRTKIKSVKFNI